MSIRRFMVQPIKIFNRVAGASNPGFSDEVETYDAGTDAMAWVNPTKADEADIDRETRLSEYEVYVEPAVVVAGTSEIVWQGRRHQIVGRPRVFYQPRGAHHLELVMRVIEG